MRRKPGAGATCGGVLKAEDFGWTRLAGEQLAAGTTLTSAGGWRSGIEPLYVRRTAPAGIRPSRRIGRTTP